MAQPTVKTVQLIDPRIEPQPDPVYDYVIAPTQNQYYKIPASGKSNSSLTFNNLTTLGIDRAYLDTFELELTVDITFQSENTTAGRLHPAPCDWTFDSFPFNKCCEEAHVNINGGAFFSQPLSYIRAKERYMDEAALSKCYENICPIHKPHLQYESGNDYQSPISQTAADRLQNFNESSFATSAGAAPHSLASVGMGSAIPTRYGHGMKNWQQTCQGNMGGFNNSIVKLGATTYRTVQHGAQHWTVVTVTWREPIFCSPFSSRYDATYGRPLYNITSMDLTFTMQNLGNMVRVMNCATSLYPVTGITVDITDANLCYQVLTIPPVLTKPLTTLVPYRRFVPYITEYSGAIDPSINERIQISSGVYTFNEIPTAIWLFVQPSKRFLQNNFEDKSSNTDAGNVLRDGNFDSNKLFAFIEHVDLTLANTTQILNTAEPPDLYRIAKANGCEDSYLSWHGYDVIDPRPKAVEYLTSEGGVATTYFAAANLKPLYYGAGSVLRLKPGVDITIPDQALISGANANNMVFKANVTATIPKHAVTVPATNNTKYSLWMLFEYVGVAAISPGQCEITMNPLGSGEIMASSPVVSATSEATEGKLEGSGIWDRILRALAIANQVAKETGIVSRLLKLIGGPNNERVNQIAAFLDKNGYGGTSASTPAPAEPTVGTGRPSKRSRGGAVIGRGLQDWSV